MLLLNDAGSDTIETSSEVRSGFPVRWAVLGVLVVGGLMWGLYAWPQTIDSTGEATADALDADDGADDDDPAADSQADDSTDQPVRSATTNKTQSESDDAESDDTEPDAEADEGPGEPLVGELTGYALAVGSMDYGTLRLVSLDTGEQLEIRGISGQPIGMIGTTLVTASWERIYTVDLAVEKPSAEQIFGSSGSWVDGAYIDDGLIWTSTGPFDGSERRLVGLSIEGEEVDSKEIDQYLGLAGGTDTDLASSTGGGVYFRNGSEFERLSTGTLRAVGEELVLVDECDDRRRCNAVWYRRGDWESVDLPTPPEPGLGWSTLEGGDRWLATYDYQLATMTLVEVATGEVARAVKNRDLYGPNLVSISPDGRWLFEPPISASDGFVVDLETGNEWPVDVALRSDAAGLFINLSDTVFDPE